MAKQKQSPTARRKQLSPEERRKRLEAFGERMQGFGGAVIKKADGTYEGLPEGMTPERHEAIMLGWREYGRTGNDDLLRDLGIVK